MINVVNWFGFVDFWINKGYVYLVFIVDERGLVFQGEKGDC